MACKVLSLSCWCVIFAVNLAEQRYMCVSEEGMEWCSCVPMCMMCQVFFFSRRPKRFWNGWRKLSHFSQNVWKYRLMNIVTTGFDAKVRQMTEMSQWPKGLWKKNDVARCDNTVKKCCSWSRTGWPSLFYSNNVSFFSVSLLSKTSQPQLFLWPWCGVYHCLQIFRIYFHIALCQGIKSLEKLHQMLRRMMKLNR